MSAVTALTKAKIPDRPRLNGAELVPGISLAQVYELLESPEQSLDQVAQLVAKLVQLDLPYAGDFKAVIERAFSSPSFYKGSTVPAHASLLTSLGSRTDVLDDDWSRYYVSVAKLLPQDGATRLPILEALRTVTLGRPGSEEIFFERWKAVFKHSWDVGMELLTSDVRLHPMLKRVWGAYSNFSNSASLAEWDGWNSTSARVSIIEQFSRAPWSKDLDVLWSRLVDSAVPTIQGSGSEYRNNSLVREALVAALGTFQSMPALERQRDYEKLFLFRENANTFLAQWPVYHACLTYLAEHPGTDSERIFSARLGAQNSSVQDSRIALAALHSGVSTDPTNLLNKLLSAPLSEGTKASLVGDFVRFANRKEPSDGALVERCIEALSALPWLGNSASAWRNLLKVEINDQSKAKGNKDSNPVLAALIKMPLEDVEPKSLTEMLSPIRSVHFSWGQLSKLLDIHRKVLISDKLRSLNQTYLSDGVKPFGSGNEIGLLALHSALADADPLVTSSLNRYIQFLLGAKTIPPDLVIGQLGLAFDICSHDESIKSRKSEIRRSIEDAIISYGVPPASERATFLEFCAHVTTWSENAVGLLRNLRDRLGIENREFAFILGHAVLSKSDDQKQDVLELLLEKPWRAEDIPVWAVFNNPSLKYTILSDRDFSRDSNVPYNASDLERVALALVHHGADKKRRAAIKKMHGLGVLDTVIGDFILSGQDTTSLGIANRISTIVVPKLQELQEQGFAMATASLASPKLITPTVRVSPKAARYSTVIIGDGPAAIIAERLLHELGFNQDAITMLSRSGQPFGIWKQGNVIDEGHNTRVTSRAFREQISADGARLGIELPEFLAAVAQPQRAKNIIHAEGREIEYDKKKRKYIVHHSSGLAIADSVCLCTGNRKPKNLESGPMKTNANTLRGLPLVRWQVEIPKEHYQRYANRSVVGIGLGNSMIAEIGQFLKMVEQGVNVRPVILTHYGAHALNNPEKLIPGFRHSIFRTTADLTRIAGDIPEVKRRYSEALKRGWIIPDVVEWNADLRGDDEGVNISYVTKTGLRATVERSPKIFALIGYQNDPELMHKLGCRVQDSLGHIDFDRITGRVNSWLPGDPGKIFALGVSARHPHDKNQEVVPGMLKIIPATLGMGQFIDAHAWAGEFVPERALTLAEILRRLNPLS